MKREKKDFIGMVSHELKTAHFADRYYPGGEH